ncbi:MAG TPA: O-antigen ligase family protein, partial [Candidatus Dormibacteraeota bacterium]|nr:O-antigen ligase family protein [Candidatus Dormibacteraeota bacterium]
AMAFLLVAALATLFSGAPAASALSATWQHGDGLLMYLAYIVMALAAARLERRDASRLMTAVLCGGGIMSTIAVGQFYGVDITAWSARMGTLPVLPAGTLGNKMFLGGYLSLLLPLCAALAVDEAERRWWMYAVASAVMCAALVASQTRAAWVGSAIAGVLLVRLVPLSGVAAKRLAALGAAAVVIAGVMVVTRPDAFLVRRAISTFNPHDISVHEHVRAWTQTLSLIGHAPVLGWGFSAPLDRFPGAASARAVRASAGGPLITDVTPNELLHVAFVTGAAGLAAYLWVWGTLVMRLWASLRAAAARPHLRAAALASLVAYFIWLQLVWSRPGPAHVFWVLAGVVVAVTRPPKDTTDPLA